MRCFLGFDGGGTKTECVLINEASYILSGGRAGPSNPLRVGCAAAMQALEEAAEVALREAHADRSDVSGLCAGLGGVGLPDSREQMRAALVKAFPRASVSVVSDLEIALAAAGDGPAIVLVVGTGSAAIGRSPGGQIARTGGHGPWIGDEGSAFHIGRRAIASVLLERDRTGIDSVLGRQILRQLECEAWADVQARAVASADEVFPRVFPVIAAAADAGDTLARDILRRAACELAALAAVLAQRLGLAGQRFSLAKFGGTLGRSQFFDMQLDAELKRALPLARIGPLRMSPAEAAARAARF